MIDKEINEVVNKLADSFGKELDLQMGLISLEELTSEIKAIRNTGGELEEGYRLKLIKAIEDIREVVDG